MKYTNFEMFSIDVKHAILTHIAQSSTKILYKNIELSFIDLVALLYIFRNPGITLTELSELRFKTKATLSPMAHRLIDLDLISRKQNKEDRRLFHFYITETGQEILKLYQEYNSRNHAKAVSSIEKKFGPEAVNTYYDISRYLCEFKEEQLHRPENIDNILLKE